MADISDVENVLVTTISNALYPTGTGNPSVLGVDCRVYRGWPEQVKLGTDLAANKVNVSVFPTDVERRTTKYPRKYFLNVLPATTLTATPSNHTVTIGGSVSSPQNVAILCNGLGVVYAVQPADTFTSIATGLAALLVTAGIPATSSGPVVTIPSAIPAQLIARVGMVASLVRETRRQKRNVMVTVWCSTPAQRDAAANAIDPVFAALDWITLPDGTAGRLLYEGSHIKDALQKELLYRRDFIYSVEYGTTDTATAAQILVERLNVKGGNDTNNPTIYTRDS